MSAHVDTNKNVNWMDSRGFWTFYIMLLASLYMAMPIAFPTHGDALTAVSFGIMHWIKGSPDDNSMGDYRELTFYEQIDQGHPWTNTKKFLMMIPTFLFLAASVATDYDTRHLLINFPSGLAHPGKLPELDRVRIFGINSTVGMTTTRRTNRARDQATARRVARAPSGVNDGFNHL
ncbi:ORM protein [Phytophthora cactorum]|nr:ORM protein [Phytophthora cactorum]